MVGKIPEGHKICAIFEHKGKMHIYTSPVDQIADWKLVENTGRSFKRTVMCLCETEANEFKRDIEILKNRIDLYNDRFNSLLKRYKKCKQNLANKSAQLKRAKLKLENLKK